MAYYSSSTCRYIKYKGSESINTGCTIDYAKSEVKYVVDAWALDKLKANDLKEDKTGYSVRLITLDDLVDNLGYTIVDVTTHYAPTADVTPSWVYNNNSSYYWTMSQKEDSTVDVWHVLDNGHVFNDHVSSLSTVRPVITLLKSAI